MTQQETALTNTPPRSYLVEGLEELRVSSERDAEKLGHLALWPNGEDEGYNNVVIRYFPSEHQRKAFPQNPTGAEGQQFIEGAQEHFEALRRFGIHVPTVTFSHETPDAPRSRIIAITEGVEGLRLPGSTQWTAEPVPITTHSDAILRLADSLLQYYGWVLDSKPAPKLYLPDLTKLDQYRLTPDGNIALIDTDPLMINPHSEQGLRRLVDDNLATVLSWVERVQVSSPEQAQQVRDLWSSIDIHTRQCRKYLTAVY